MLNKIILTLWITGGLFLFLYSFTQVDLSLTLSQASLWQTIQTKFQYVGWFNRPLSTYLYIGLLIYLFSLFLVTVWQTGKSKFSSKEVWTIIIFMAVILIPSYNAFSYDLFNYIFDARIVSNYNLNPYEYKPLDFAGDPMLSFMRSTHRVYPYGPTWLGITVPLTFISNEIFALSLILFKSLSALAYLGTAFFIKKIAENLKLKNVNLAVILFALNPLVIIESLVSSHNEIVMMFFAIFSLYLLFINKKIFSGLLMIISVGIKYATVVFIPIYLLKLVYRKIDNRKLIEYSLALSVIAIIATSLASGQNKGAEFQPWYLLLTAPFIGLIERKFVKFVFFGVCLFALFSYIPFLYNGLWPEDIVNFKNILVLGGLIFGLGAYYLAKTINSKIA
jgi:hypothetical protein